MARHTHDEFAEDLPDPGLPPKVAEWFADMRLMYRAWYAQPMPKTSK